MRAVGRIKVLPKGAPIPTNLDNRLMTEPIRSPAPSLSRNASSVLSPSRDPSRSKHKEEVKFFKRLNWAIDQIGDNMLVAKAVEHLKLLKGILESLKMGVHRATKGLETEEEIFQTSHISYYCECAFSSFGKVQRLIERIIIKDESKPHPT